MLSDWARSDIPASAQRTTFNPNLAHDYWKRLHSERHFNTQICISDVTRYPSSWANTRMKSRACYAEQARLQLMHPANSKSRACRQVMIHAIYSVMLQQLEHELVIPATLPPSLVPLEQWSAWLVIPRSSMAGRSMACMHGWCT